MSEHYSIKIYSNEPINFSKNIFHNVFSQRKNTEFYSILRSPHANKNAQEQFEKIQYKYFVRFKNRKQTKAFLVALKSNQWAPVKAWTMTQEKTVTFTNYFQSGV